MPSPDWSMEGPMMRQVDRFQSGADLARVLGEWSCGTGPLYRQLAWALDKALREGALQPGERLPSERQLAEVLAISRTTVVGAYDELRSRGVLNSRRGSGTRVSAAARPSRDDGRVRTGSGGAIFQRLIDGPGPLISLTCAAEGSAEGVAGALDEAARHDLDDLLSDPGYHPGGLPSLRTAIADHYTALGLTTSPEQVLVTTGAQQALVLAGDLYLQPQSTVVVETPGWPAALDAFKAAGARLTPVPLDDEGLDLQQLAAVLGAQAPGLLFTMPSFHNPTGTLMSPARRRRVIEMAAFHDLPVVEDNAHAGINHSGTPEPAPMAAFAPEDAEILTVGSLSKIVWGGLRIGWVRAQRSLIERLARRKALADLGGPLLDQAVAARLIPHLDDLAAQRSRVLEERFQVLASLLRDKLPDWRWHRPAGGANLWVALPGVNADAFTQLALRHGVELVPGSAMDPARGHDNYVRIPVTHPLEVLTEVVSRLARAWADIQRHGPHDTHSAQPIV